MLRAQIFSIHELAKVIMICKDEDLEFVTFQVVALSLKSLNNSYKLLIVNFIPIFGKDQKTRSPGAIEQSSPLSLEDKIV